MPYAIYDANVIIEYHDTYIYNIRILEDNFYVKSDVYHSNMFRYRHLFAAVFLQMTTTVQNTKILRSAAQNDIMARN